MTERFVAILLSLLVTPLGLIAQRAETNTEEVDEYAVYSAVISQKFVRPDTRLVVIIDPTSSGNADLDIWRQKQLEPISAETLASFKERDKDTKALKKAFTLSVAYRIVDLEEVKKLFLAGMPEEGWKEFYQLYPQSNGYLHLSRVGFNNERTEALITLGGCVDPSRARVNIFCFQRKTANGRLNDLSALGFPKTMAKRKIIVYVATSADGFIARKDGGVEWLDRPRPKGNYGMGEFWKSIDTIVLGRKTYDFVLKFVKEGKSIPKSKHEPKHYVFSRRPPKKVLPGFEFVKEPIKQFAERLRTEKGKNIFMMGGGGLIASFLDEGQIDEFIIHVIPTFIGEGIPLIAPRHRTVPLTLLSTKKFPDGVVRLHYKVSEGRSRKKRSVPSA